MPVHKQLSIFLPNRPGFLARASGTLSEANVNILALSVHDAVDSAVVRLVLDDPMKGLLLLEQEGFYVTEQEVVLLPVENRPGILSQIAQSLGRADINIQYAYCTAARDQTSGCIVLKTDEPGRALDCLRDFEFGQFG